MSDDSFIREVDDDLRTEQMNALWQRFKYLIFGAIALVIAATAANVSYETWKENSASKSGDDFLTALNFISDKKLDEALGVLKTLETDGHGAYPILAKLRAATIYEDKGELDTAISMLSSIGNDNSVPTALREVAVIRAGYLLADNGSYKEVAAQVEELTNAENPMRNSAREALGLSAWKAKDSATAKKWFELVAGDTTVSPRLRQRAEVMLELIVAQTTVAE